MLLAQLPEPSITTSGTIVNLLPPIINGVLGIIGVVGVVVLIFGAFQYATAAGNEEQIETAKKTITAAIIGLVIIAASFIIVNTIIAILPK